MLHAVPRSFDPPPPHDDDGDTPGPLAGDGEPLSPGFAFESLVNRFAPFETLALATLDLHHRGDRDIAPMTDALARALLEFADDLHEAQRRVTRTLAAG